MKLSYLLTFSCPGNQSTETSGAKVAGGKGHVDPSCDSEIELGWKIYWNAKSVKLFWN